MPCKKPAAQYMFQAKDPSRDQVAQRLCPHSFGSVPCPPVCGLHPLRPIAPAAPRPWPRCRLFHSLWHVLLAYAYYQLFDELSKQEAEEERAERLARAVRKWLFALKKKAA